MFWLRTQLFSSLPAALPISIRPPLPTSCTSNRNFVPHRLSRRLIRTARLIASNRVEGDKYPPAPRSCARLTLHYLVIETFKSKALVRVSKVKSILQHGQPRSIDYSGTQYTFRFSGIGTTEGIDLSDGSISEEIRKSLGVLFKPKCSLDLAAFNVRTNKLDKQENLKFLK